MRRRMNPPAGVRFVPDREVGLQRRLARSCRTTGCIGAASRSRIVLGGDAGAGGPRRIPDPSPLMPPSRRPSTVARRRGRGTKTHPGMFHGRKAAAQDWRCRNGEAGSRAAQGRRDIYRDAEAQSQRHRAARRHAGHGNGNDAGGPRLRAGQMVTTTACVDRRQVFGIEPRSRVHGSRRPMSAAASAAKTLWQHQIACRCSVHAIVPAGRSGSCFRARASTASLAAARCTEQRVAIGAQADGRFDALIHTGVVGDDVA